MHVPLYLCITYICILYVPVLVFTMGNFGPGKCVASDAVAHFNITFQVNFCSSIAVMAPLVLPLVFPLFSCSFQGHYIHICTCPIVYT